MTSKKCGSKYEPLAAVVESLGRMAEWEIRDAIHQALLGNYWNGPKDWRPYPPNPTGLRSPRPGGDKQDPVVGHLN